MHTSKDSVQIFKARITEVSVTITTAMTSALVIGAVDGVGVGDDEGLSHSRVLRELSVSRNSRSNIASPSSILILDAF